MSCIKSGKDVQHCAAEAIRTAQTDALHRPHENYEGEIFGPVGVVLKFEDDEGMFALSLLRSSFVMSL
jgi:hypothetical protein